MSNFQQQQMGVGQMMPQMGLQQQQQQRPPQNANASAQIQQMIFTTLTQQPGPLVGWQAQVLPNERMGLIFNIIGNLRLASQHQPNPPTLQRMIEIGIRFEKDIFEKSPNKENYKHQVAMKLEQLLERRNQNQANMQQQIQQQAQAQAQAQQQAQQMMMNQNPMQGQGPRPMPQQGAQQGFSHLQHQMQASPIPGQQPPQTPMGIANQGSQGMAQNQHQQFTNAMQQGQAQQNAQGRIPNGGQPQLSQQDNVLVMDLTNRLSAQATEEEKANLRMSLQQRMEPQQFARYQAQGIDPVLLYFRNQAMTRLRAEKQVRMQAQQQMALGQQPQNGPGSAPPMQQQRSMQPSPLSNQNQPPTTGGGNPNFDSFMGNMGDLAAQQQQQGVMAQAEGQMVVPVSGAPRNATPQPGVMPGQAMNEQRGPPNANPGTQQQQRHMMNSQQAQQLQQQRLQHQAAQQQEQVQRVQQSQVQARVQAQLKAQHIALQGQPGGMGPGPVPPQPSPAMPTLNAPIRTSSQQQLNQSETPQPNPTSQFGQPLDPRFIQGNQRPPGFGPGLNSAALTQAMFSQMPPEAQKTLSQMPPEKLNEVVSKWHAQRQQDMNVNGQGRPQMPMQVGQMRPGQQMPPGGPFNPQNQGQFMNGPGQRPQQPGMAGTMNAQQQLLLQQQMAALRPNGMQQQQQQQQQQRNAQQNFNIEQRTAMQMDGVEVPQVYQSHPNMPQGMPPDVKKWGQLKQWASTNPNLGPAGLESIKQLQRHHYQNILRSRQQQNGSAGMMQPAGPGLPGAGMPAPVAQMTQNPVQMPNGMPMGPGPRQPTPQEIQSIRNHPSGKMAQATDDQIRTMFIRNHQQQQQQAHHQQQAMTQQQLHQRQVMAAQMSRMQAAQQPQQPGLNPTPAAPPQKPNQTPQQKPQPASESTPTANNTNAARAARTQPGDNSAARNPSPTQATKSLKRASSSDDVVEVPNPNMQQAQPASHGQESNQASQQGPPKLTPQQIAQLDPERRKQYQNFLQKQQMAQTARMQLNPVDIGKLKAIEKEEHERVSVPLSDVPMEEEYKTKIRAQIRSIISSMQNVNKAMPRWYQITHNEERARSFFRARFRLAKQFHDGEMMQQLKDNYSISLQEVEHTKLLLNAIIQDLSSKFPNMKKRDEPKPQGASATQEAAQSQTQPAQAPTPLNAANLQQQQQQLKMHQRSNSRSSHTPAAPTSEQPPIHFGGARSPHGAPSYLNNNTLTQEKMHIPARKKQKQNSTPIPGQGTPGSTSSPQVPKAVSPELRRQQVEAKSHTKSFPCPDPECDGRNATFDSQETLEAHRSEEHVIGDPWKYAQDNLASVTGLDNEGQPKKASGQEGAPTITAPTSSKMVQSGSKQAHTPNVKGENPSAATTPMNRQVSMNRQGSAIGGKAIMQSNVGPIKDAGSKAQPASKDSAKPEPQVSAATDPWANATIDPTELYNTFQSFETGAGGAISDMNVYRSITPNDTPESSKDGVSEPNSDITDGVNLDINLDLDFDSNWNPFGSNDADALFDMGSFNVNGGMDDMIRFDDDQILGGLSWDDDAAALDKPFSFDTSMYSMNTE